MDNPSQPPTSSNLFSNNNVVIITLLFLLVLSFLGINLLYLSGNVLQNVGNMIFPFFQRLFGLIGYTTGTVVNKTADVVGNTAKVGIDIAHGSVENVGNLLIKGAGGNANYFQPTDLSNALNRDNSKPENNPNPPTKEKFIQEPMSTSKKTWVLNEEGSPGLNWISVDDYDKNMSSQVFPHQKMALNPTLTP